MRVFIYTFFLLTLLISCAEPKPNTEAKVIQDLDSQIMAIHDEAMPKISKVLSLRKLVQQKIESCIAPDSCAQWQKASYALTKADAQMMDWMRKYQKPVALDTAFAYLKQQEQIIITVSKDITNSILLADSLLKK